jgi:hypothetical protein
MGMRSLHSEADRALLLQRLERLTDATPARWGRMNVAQMLYHSAESIRMAIGELEVKPRGPRIFRSRPVKFLIFRLPFPKGAPTAPELCISTAVEFAVERARLAGLVSRFADVPRSGNGPVHPLFGALTWKEWGCLQYRHVDHHLSQFGV